MIPEQETFDGTWPFAAHYFEGAGFRQHYIDEPGDGPKTIVCLHGEPTWGYLYRASSRGSPATGASSSLTTWDSARAKRRKNANTPSATTSITWKRSC